MLKILLTLLVVFSFTQNAIASPLIDRLQEFPQWHNKPPVQIASGDLEYPEWMSGTWNVTSTLIEQFAPLAPDIVTPGFEDNQNYLNQAIAFQVRFGQEYYSPRGGFLARFSTAEPMVVADRAFNGKNIAQAYLGDANVYQVKVDPNNPNRQITLLKGERRLISTIAGRSRETPQRDRFIATEISKQLFKSPSRIYLNEVETTSDYQLLPSGNITANQITAIYLSSQDPDYFVAGNRPVALYHYNLNLELID
jgi:hypothetical protein